MRPHPITKSRLANRERDLHAVGVRISAGTTSPLLGLIARSPGEDHLRLARSGPLMTLGDASRSRLPEGSSDVVRRRTMGGT
jgi:hypothetical protein